MCKSDGYEKLSESIVEYEVSCLGPKADSCLPPPGLSFKDIEEFIFWGALLIIIFGACIMAKWTRSTSNYN